MGFGDKKTNIWALKYASLLNSRAIRNSPKKKRTAFAANNVSVYRC